MNAKTQTEIKKALKMKLGEFGLDRTTAPSGWENTLEGLGFSSVNRQSICDGYGVIVRMKRGDEHITVTDLQTSARRTFTIR